ncbi:MHYT domain-containing protein [Streptomyces sp. NPDC001068]|uniref:MHYT domain-containing protein n=1 Tax=Streptomyces sp. NPDC001068 TaxID=3364544 RepID=UPI00368C9E3D
MARFRARTRAGHTWLALAALALGAGLWGMSTITVLGYGVPGGTTRHDTPPTVLSAVACAGSAALGLVLAERRRTWPGLCAAGVTLTCGLTVAHVLETAALGAHPLFHSSLGAASAAFTLGAVAVTGILWLTVTVRTGTRAGGGCLPAAALLCAAQYTGLAALTGPVPSAPAGAHRGLGGPGLSVAVAAVLTLVVLTVAFNLYVTPVEDVRGAPAPLVTREMPAYLLVDDDAGVRRTVDRPAPVTSGADRAVEAGPVLRVGG